MLCTHSNTWMKNDPQAMAIKLFIMSMPVFWIRVLARCWPWPAGVGRGLALNHECLCRVSSYQWQSLVGMNLISSKPPMLRSYKLVMPEREVAVPKQLSRAHIFFSWHHMVFSTWDIIAVESRKSLRGVHRLILQGHLWVQKNFPAYIRLRSWNS